MTIETHNLRLVPVQKENGKEFFKLWSNQDVVKYTYNILRYNIEECEEWIETILDSLDENKDVIPFAVYYNNEIIGFAGAPTRDYLKKEYALFYQFDEEYWGRGFGYEVAKGIVNYLFKERDAKVIYADVATINKGSIRILEKLGMKNIGTNAGSFKKEGIILDLYDFKITKDEWIEVEKG